MGWGGAEAVYHLMCLVCAAITANMHSYVPRVRRLCNIGSAILALRCKPLMNAISNAHGQGCECNHKNHTTPRSRSSKGHNGSCINNARLNYNPIETNTQFNTTPNQTRPDQTRPHQCQMMLYERHATQYHDFLKQAIPCFMYRPVVRIP